MQFASKLFTQSMKSVSPQYCCFLKLRTKSFLMFCVENLPFLKNVELFLEFRIVIIKIAKTAKGLFAKIALGK